MLNKPNNFYTGIKSLDFNAVDEAALLAGGAVFQVSEADVSRTFKWVKTRKTARADGIPS